VSTGRAARTVCKEIVRMDPLHYMLPEDEIFLCGMMLVYGFIAGAVARLIAGRRERRTA
jgi:hypothetical protein